MKPDHKDVLIVDDDPDVCELLNRVLTAEGFDCVCATSGLHATSLLAERDFAVTICDVAMPDMTGLELLAHTRTTNHVCKMIVITGFPSTENLAQSLSLGAFEYFRKPFNIGELVDAARKACSKDTPMASLPARAAEAIRLEDQYRRTSLESIRALVHTVEARDPYTCRHSEQVAYYAEHLAQQVGLGKREVDSIRVAALVHDIGKIAVPDNVLTKPGPLSDKERSEIRHHPEIGYNILKEISVFADEASLVRHHHENWDGSGYPEGLAGKDIPAGSRILNVADSVDAMLMQRSYKRPYTIKEALGELSRCSGTQFDPDLVPTAIDWFTSNLQRIIRTSTVA